MDLILQIWGGSFYLLNKIFLSIGEKSNNSRNWRISGWSVYLIGLPAWLIILADKHDWIIVSIEAGGAPAMILGLIVALKKTGAPEWLEKGVEKFVYMFLLFGVSYSIYDFGGITTVSQILEIFLTIGFLLGTFFLAKQNPKGWLWFGLMNTSNILLMFLQDKPWLSIQQIISLIFVIYGYKNSRE